MRVCEWCEIKEVTTEVSYQEVNDGFISCCDDCFDDQYRNDEDIKHVVVLT